jgi:hypothetical protein
VLGLAGAFEEAVEWIRKEIEGGKPLSTVMLSMPRFEDGEVVINKIFSFSPLIIGYADPEQSIELDRELILKVSWIAKNLGMKTVVSPPDIHILRDSEPVGIVRRNGYGASSPILLKELARQIGGGKTGRPASIGVKDSWINSLKILLGDRQARRMILSVILFIILPTIVVFYASMTYPFLFGGEMISFAMPIVVFFATTLLTYLFLKK